MGLWDWGTSSKWDAETSPMSFGDWNPSVGSNQSSPAWDNFVGTKDKAGWGGMALNAASGIGSYIMGSKQLSLGKKQLSENRRQFSEQFRLQKELINKDIYNQGNKAYNINKNANMTPEEYYEKNKIT